jgi:hypothetical protein
MPKVRASSATMGTTRGPRAVLQQVAQHAHEGHGGAHFLAVGFGANCA